MPAAASPGSCRRYPPANESVAGRQYFGYGELVVLVVSRGGFYWLTQVTLWIQSAILIRRAARLRSFGRRLKCRKFGGQTQMG